MLIQWFNIVDWSRDPPAGGQSTAQPPRPTFPLRRAPPARYFARYFTTVFVRQPNASVSFPPRSFCAVEHEAAHSSIFVGAAGLS